MNKKRRRNILTTEYGRAMRKVSEAARKNIPGSDYLARVTNDALYDMASAVNMTKLYPMLALDPDITAKCGVGESAICRERLMLAVGILDL